MGAIIKVNVNNGARARAAKKAKEAQKAAAQAPLPVSSETQPKSRIKLVGRLAATTPPIASEAQPKRKIKLVGRLAKPRRVIKIKQRKSADDKSQAGAAPAQLTLPSELESSSPAYSPQSLKTALALFPEEDSQVLQASMCLMMLKHDPRDINNSCGQ